MSRTTAQILAALLTLIIVGIFAYWGLGGLIRHPATVQEPLSAARQPAETIEYPPDWQKIDTGQGFSFYAPPGTQFHALPGKDSALGEIAGPSFTLRSDFGFYSNDLHEAENYPDYSQQQVSVDGRDGLIRRATIASQGGPSYFVGLYVQQAVFHREYPGRWAALEIHGSTDSPQSRAMVEKMFLTIQFAKYAFRL